MTGEASQSDRIMADARRSLVDQRAGGRRTASIGRASAALKRKHRLAKLRNIVLAIGAIWLAVIVAGLVLGGIGVSGIIVALVAAVIAAGVFGSFPKMAVPTRAALTGSDVRSLVGRTELWLENQRPALPAPAVQIVDRIGGQLDALGLQLAGLPENTPAATEVRKLVGEHLPEIVSSYTSIPGYLRSEPGAGQSPDQQLTDSLGKISGEIDSVTRQLASGAIDNLAIKTRYLDYKYGQALDEPGRTN